VLIPRCFLAATSEIFHLFRCGMHTVQWANNSISLSQSHHKLIYSTHNNLKPLHAALTTEIPSWRNVSAGISGTMTCKCTTHTYAAAGGGLVKTTQVLTAALMSWRDITITAVVAVIKRVSMTHTACNAGSVWCQLADTQSECCQGQQAEIAPVTHWLDVRNICLTIISHISFSFWAVQ